MFDLKRFLQKDSEHPLANLQLAKEVLANLPSGNPAKALEEVSLWLDTLREGKIDLQDRIAVLGLLDETGHPFQRALSRDYLAATRMRQTKESRLWVTLYEYWRSLATNYFDCVESIERGRQTGADQLRQQLPVLVTRALRAFGGQVKWLHLRYRPIDERTWSDISKLYWLAETRGFDDSEVVPYAASQTASSVRQELLKILMLEAATPSRLVPVQIALADRMVTQFAAEFVLQNEPEGCGYFFDLTTRKAPSRLMRGGRVHSMMRFFGAGQVLQELEAIVRQVKLSAIPHELTVDGDEQKDEMLVLLNQLLQAWSSTPPKRKYARQLVVSRLNVVHGLPEIRRRIAGVEMQGKISATELEPMQDDTENWVMENVSDCGLGALLPELNEDWIHVGTLLGLRPESSKKWGIGVVRRLTHTAQMEVVVGIQKIAQEPFPVRLRPLGFKVSRSDKVAAVEQHESFTAILLPREAHCMEEACILLEPGGFAAAKEFEMQLGGEKTRIRLTAMLEQGGGFERVGFSVVESGARKQ